MNTEVAKPKRLIEVFGERYQVEADKVLTTLKVTAFRQDGNSNISNEQMMALLIVANQYKLNPFTKEIFAFPHKGSIVPVVSVDGWSRIMNENPNMDGIEFEYSPETIDFHGKTVHEWIDCIIYRKDRSRPTKAREFFSEVSKETPPWKSHPNRMHRHKAEIQCARIAFGFAGIYDQDEAERIIESSTVIEVSQPKVQGHNEEQKEYFDSIIEREDSLSMYAFLHTVSDGLAASLFNSFPEARETKDGQGKTYYKKLTNDLKERGEAQFQEYMDLFADAMRDGDTLLIGENLAELSSEVIELLKQRLGDEFVAIAAELEAAA